jgi:S1-C subfamily serine protease
MNGSDAYSLFASLYPTAREATGVARRAGLPIQFIEAEGAAIIVWSSILGEARKRGMMAAIEEVVREDYPGLVISSATPRAGPLAQPRFLGPLIDYEKITGAQSTLLPISFLALGMQRARSVMRVACGDKSYGSGFLIDRNLVVTNHHVLRSPSEAAGAHVDFGYELTERGTIREPVSFKLNPALGFHTSEEDDWTVVRVDTDANRDWGAIPLPSTSETVKAEEFVNIIQHPGGGPKQIALYHNVVVFADESRVQYLTDTMRGSSGSPVFDSSWRLVAIHHAEVKRPATKQALFCNQGIAMRAFLAGLEKAGL